MRAGSATRVMPLFAQFEPALKSLLQRYESVQTIWECNHEKLASCRSPMRTSCEEAKRVRGRDLLCSSAEPLSHSASPARTPPGWSRRACSRARPGRSKIGSPTCAGRGHSRHRSRSRRRSVSTSATCAPDRDGGSTSPPCSPFPGSVRRRRGRRRTSGTASSCGDRNPAGCDQNPAILGWHPRTECAAIAVVEPEFWRTGNLPRAESPRLAR
jgi:hypothetical protein